MAGQSLPDRYVRLLLGLGFILAVMSSPLRPLSYGIASARTRSGRCNFGAISSPSSPAPVKSVASYPVRVKALPCERKDEKKLSAEAGLARSLIDLIPHSALKPAHDRTALASNPALHSLRC